MTSTRSTYWQDTLAGAPIALEVVTDRPRPRAMTEPLRSRPVRLPFGMPTDVFAFGLAAFQLVVSRWSGQRDVVVIGIVDGVRLPLRTRISSVSPFSGLVGQVSRTVAEAHAQAAELAGMPAPTQIGFQLSEGPFAGDDLTLVLTPGRERIVYRPELFDAATIDAMAAAFTRLCAQVLAEPDALLYTVDGLAPDQWDELVHARNATTTEYPYADHCIHQLVEDRVDSCPDAIAAECGDQFMTYRRLDERANRLARHLVSLGVSRETPVCVLLDRSLDLLVALLGVLKAGGCYVPMDPSYPAERLSFMASETGAKILLTRSDLVHNAPSGGWDKLCLDSEQDSITARSADRLPVRSGPDHLAYVIYTSGSTGRPKGVMVPHRGVVHYLAWCGWAYQAEQGNGAPVHSPLSFDLTVTGLFLPLMYGKTVTLVPDSEHPVVGLSTRLGNAPDYTFVKLTPAHLNALAQCLPDPLDVSAQGTRWLVVGGEQLTAEHLTLWREHAPDTMISNEYGPTETSVACVTECRPAGELTTSPVSVGRPFWNTRIYIVDDELNLVASGVPGELLIGGVGVTRGYWGRPALTADKFIPNPFGPGRLYRSGDIVRYLPDGRLEFVARIDRQVKVRGYRVELGEIEARLTEFPGVRQAVVLLKSQRLVCYLESDREIDRKDVQRFLRDRLPDYMIPERTTTLAEFPLTPNAKIDHTRLP
ncbi:MAG TPA: amino acid adenylation domain-containing protein [Pseudonocardiaceae bacterium]